MAGKAGKRALKVRADILGHALHQFFTLQDLQVLQRHGGGNRVSRIGKTVRKPAFRIPQLVRDRIGDHQCRNRLVAGRQPFRQSDEIGAEAEQFGSRPGTKPAESADHLIQHEQHVVLLANSLHLLQISFRRKDQTARPLDRLADKEGDIFGTEFPDLDLEGMRRLLRKCRLGHVRAVQEFIRCLDMGEIRHAGAALLMHRADATGADRRQGGAVISLLPADNDPFRGFADLLPVIAPEADCTVADLGAGIREQGGIEMARHKCRQHLRQLRRRCRRRVEKGVVVGKLLHLTGSHVSQLLAAITDIDAPQTGERIKIAMPLIVPEVTPLSPLDHGRPADIHEPPVIGEGMQMMGGIPLPQGFAVRIAHTLSPAQRHTG